MSKQIESEIASEHYFVAGDGVYGDAHKRGDHSVQQFPAALDRITFCVLTLINGFTIVGESHCAKAENFDAELGRKWARINALEKLQPFFVFRNRDTEMAEEIGDSAG